MCGSGVATSSEWATYETIVMTETRFRQAFLLLLVMAISAAFVAMIRAFLLTILLAAIFAG